MAKNTIKSLHPLGATASSFLKQIWC